MEPQPLPSLVVGLDRLYHHADLPFTPEVLDARIRFDPVFCDMYHRYLKQFCNTAGKFVLEHALFECPRQFYNFSFNTQSSATLLVDRGLADNRPYIAFPPDLATQCHTLLLRAMQGSGKTFAFAEFIRQHRVEFPTVLIVTPRQCVALQMVKALLEHGVPCCMYQDHKTLQHGHVNICQLDSLPRFAFRDYHALRAELGNSMASAAPGHDVLTAYNDFADYHISTLVPVDILAMDEVDAVVEHLCSPTLTTQGMLPRDILVGYLKRCKLMIAIQADISDNVWDFIWSLRGKPDPVTNLDPGFRLYWRISPPPVPKTFTRVWSLDRFVNLLKQDVEAGKRVVVLSDSKTEIEVYISKFIEDFNVRIEDCIVYKADSTRATKRTMACCNEAWVGCKYLFYSPTVSFGVDFNPDIPHFHAVYCHFNGNTVSGTVAFQMINRCRVLLDNKVIFYTNSRRPKPEVIEYLCDRGACIDPVQAIYDLISDKVFADTAYRSFNTPLIDTGALINAISPLDMLAAHAAVRRAIFRSAVAVYEKRYRFLPELLLQIKQFGSRLTHDAAPATPVVVQVARIAPPPEPEQESEHQAPIVVEPPVVAAPPPPPPAPLPHRKRRRELLKQNSTTLAMHIAEAMDLTPEQFEQLSVSDATCSEEEQYNLMRYTLTRGTGFDFYQWAQTIPQRDGDDVVRHDVNIRDKHVEHLMMLMDLSGFTQCAGQCVYVNNMSKFLTADQPDVVRKAAHVDLVVSMISEHPLHAFKQLLKACGIDAPTALFSGDAVLATAATATPAAASAIDEFDVATPSSVGSGTTRADRANRVGRSLKTWHVDRAKWDAISECCSKTVFPAFAFAESEDWVMKSQQTYLFVMTLLNRAARRLFGGQGNIIEHKIAGGGARLQISFGDRATQLKKLVEDRKRIYNT